jgi:hypothetical protein
MSDAVYFCRQAVGALRVGDRHEIDREPGAVDARYLFPETAFPDSEFGQFLSKFAS